MRTISRVFAGAAAALICASAHAAPPTIAQAVEAALRNYPSVRVYEEQTNAAAAGIALARAAYLPRIDALAQVNRATRNNVFGMLLPQSVIPSISGPVLGTNNLGTAWGSAVGALVTWEPFDFGLRRANAAVAEAARAQFAAAAKRNEFELATTAADACLTLAATRETVRAAEAGVERAEVAARIIGAQVRAELRPGADQSRAEAEVAAARTQLARARQATEIARAALARYLGVEPAQADISAPALGALPPETPAAAPDPSAHPLAAEQRAAVEQANAQLRALEHSWFPHFYLQGTAYARGTGAETGGSILEGANGLAPNVQNYALGFSVNFPVFDFAAIHAREAAQSATVRAQSARAQQVATDLRAQWNAAAAALEGARQVAANTPAQVAAAGAAARQAQARYESGLGGIDEVAEAQRLLTQAEIDDALARLGVWRGLLGVAAAAGDIRPFLAEASR
jgi:outer membrane protein